MRGTCPPQRPGEGIEFESGWAEPHPGSLADGFPAGRGKRFGKEEIPYDERTCIIVLEFDGGNQAGIIVDRVREVTFAKPDEICATPTNKNVNANHYIKNIIENSEGIMLLLTCEKLVMEQ